MFVGEVVLGLGAVYVWFMQKCFETAWLPWQAIVKPLIAFVAICLIDEIRKLIARRMEESSARDVEDEEETEDDETTSEDDEDEEESEDEKAKRKPLLCSD